MQIPCHALRIEDFSCQVRLGCGPEERAVPQEVRFSIEVRFKQAPLGAGTDEIADTVCYARIAEILRSHCASGEFKLIERLATEAFVLLKEYIGTDASLALILHKVRPPVESLLGGSSYRCGDHYL